MGLYRSVAAPLLFTLPPEAAHRLAHRSLGLPLPWERIGGAVHDPALRVTVAGIELANPIGLAAGFDKTGRHLDALGRLGFGYVIAGTFTRRPRRGNPKPRIVRSPNRLAIVNAMGLPNPGAVAGARTLVRVPRATPRLASIADEIVADVLETHALLEPHVDAVELNVSCPNVSWGRDRDNEAHLAELLRKLGERRRTPLFVKLPPFSSDTERDVVLALAAIAQEGGAEGLTCSNTVRVADGRLASGAGGLSGAPLLERTLRILGHIRRATGGALPVNASGGVFTAADALACVEAGATTVQVYSALIYRGPALLGELTRGLQTETRGRGVGVPGLVGSARPRA